MWRPNRSFAALFVILWSGPASAGQIPTLPPGPVLNKSAYPNCKDDYIKSTNNGDRFLSAQDCIRQLERYNKFILIPFPLAVQDYSDELNIIEANFRKTSGSADDKKTLASNVNSNLAQYKSIDATNRFGSAYTDYYITLQAYKDDEEKMRDVENNQNQ